MNANEKIYVKSYVAYTTEDKYNEGEVGWTNHAWDNGDIRIDGRFDTIWDALRAVCEKNCFDFKMENWQNIGLAIEGECGRFDFDTLVDEDNSEALEYEIKEWKKGSRRLWNCHLEVFLGVVAERNLTLGEMGEMGEVWK